MNTPKIEEIKKAYGEITEIMKEVKTVEQCREIQKKHALTIEVNGFLVEEYINQYESESCADAAIDWIRVENYEMLSYVYFHKDGTIYFDVWSDEVEAEFLVDITIDKLEAAYPDGLKWLEDRKAERIYEKFDSIGSENTEH